ncbi:MAG: hypothetical protein M3Q49_17165 [Actinomycetota bacterium]|nr:hypothetical protein [Actinomycetota bacterium]
MPSPAADAPPTDHLQLRRLDDQEVIGWKRYRVLDGDEPVGFVTGGTVEGLVLRPEHLGCLPQPLRRRLAGALWCASVHNLGL